MKNSNEFERYSNSWKKASEDSASQHRYTEKDINAFKMNTSRNFSRALHKTIWFDIILKGLLLVSMLLLIWFYRSTTHLVITIVLLIGIAAYFLIKEHLIKKKFRHIDELSSDLSTVLKQKIHFYSTSFPKLKSMLAFTNALFVWVGSMFYYYSKYGYYKIEDLTDIIVSTIMISLAFGISYFATTIQYKYHIRELKECLTQLSDEQEATMTIKRQLWRKRVILIAALLAIVLGIVLFTYLLIVK